MIQKLIDFLILCLPYGLIITIFKYNRAIPANIRTSNGSLWKAIILSKDFGIICRSSVYIENRLQELNKQRKNLEQANLSLVNELNQLSFDAKESLYGDNYEQQD